MKIKQNTCKERIHSFFVLILHIVKSAKVNSEFKQRNDVYSKKVKAGKRRTYFFDVRTTRNNDYFLTITESKKVGENEEYERHKIFVYKEDLVKFVNALQETVDHIKTELLPDFDFDTYADEEYNGEYNRGNYSSER